MDKAFPRSFLPLMVVGGYIAAIIFKNSTMPFPGSSQIGFENLYESLRSVCLAYH